MNKQRYEQALSMRKDNKTYAQIGEFLGVGKQRARQIVMRAWKIENGEPRWTDGLTIRTANSLTRSGFRSKEQLRDAVLGGKLVIGAYRNIGGAAIIEIGNWLGILVPKVSMKIRKAIELLEKHGYRVEKIINK